MGLSRKRGKVARKIAFKITKTHAEAKKNHSS